MPKSVDAWSALWSGDTKAPRYRWVRLGDAFLTSEPVPNTTKAPEATLGYSFATKRFYVAFNNHVRDRNEEISGVANFDGRVDAENFAKQFVQRPMTLDGIQLQYRLKGSIEDKQRVALELKVSGDNVYVEYDHLGDDWIVVTTPQRIDLLSGPNGALPHHIRLEAEPLTGKKNVDVSRYATPNVEKIQEDLIKNYIKTVEARGKLKSPSFFTVEASGQFVLQEPNGREMRYPNVSAALENLEEAAHGSTSVGPQ